MSEPVRSASAQTFWDDVETVFERMRKNYPSVKWLKRPSNRPFAGITTHDPDGNVFDLSQKDMSNRAAIYVENDGKVNRRHIDHVAVRTMHPTEMAQFYRDVFELAPKNKTPGDPNHYLTDGHVTLVLMPWDITTYEGRFWHSLPSPYVTQAPTHGNPCLAMPVLMRNSAGE